MAPDSDTHQTFAKATAVLEHTGLDRVVLPYPNLCTVNKSRKENSMARNSASRKYQLTINNPKEHGFDHDRIKATLEGWPSVAYWCMCDEVGAEGTYHTHLYVVFPNAVMFSTIQKRFYGAHIEPAMGTHQENRDYVRKEGKWAEDAKKETNLPDTFEEFGEMPFDRGEKVKQAEEIYGMIKDGHSNAEILEKFPSAMTKLGHLEQTRQTILEDLYKKEFRELDVTYLYGEAGTGKTRSVMEKYGYENVYRITNYQHPFDGYKGQNVIVFEEFRGNLPISEMLNYLDGYPCMLPCRYADKAACYTKVYLISNVPLDQQYPMIQTEQPKTWNALKRRIHNIYELFPDDTATPFD